MQLEANKFATSLALFHGQHPACSRTRSQNKIKSDLRGVSLMFLLVRSSVIISLVICSSWYPLGRYGNN